MVFHFIEGGLMTEWNWQVSKFKSIFFISRFISKRRLLLISAPSEDDYLFQQQLSAVRGQECPLGTCFKRPAVTRKCYKEARSQTWVDLSWLWNSDLKSIPLNKTVRIMTESNNEYYNMNISVLKMLCIYKIVWYKSHIIWNI